jgi:hypothetical protein
LSPSPKYTGPDASSQGNFLILNKRPSRLILRVFQTIFDPKTYEAPSPLFKYLVLPTSVKVILQAKVKLSGQPGHFSIIMMA